MVNLSFLFFIHLLFYCLFYVGENNGIYLATDDKPLTRSEILNLFQQSDNNVCLERKGKICDSSWTRNQLNWNPKYKSFIEYFSSLKTTTEK